MMKVTIMLSPRRTNFSATRTEEQGTAATLDASNVSATRDFLAKVCALANQTTAGHAFLREAERIDLPVVIPQDSNACPETTVLKPFDEQQALLMNPNKLRDNFVAAGKLPDDTTYDHPALLVLQASKLAHQLGHLDQAKLGVEIPTADKKSWIDTKFSMEADSSFVEWLDYQQRRALDDNVVEDTLLEALTELYDDYIIDRGATLENASSELQAEAYAFAYQYLQENLAKTYEATDWREGFPGEWEHLFGENADNDKTTAGDIYMRDYFPNDAQHALSSREVITNSSLLDQGPGYASIVEAALQYHQTQLLQA